MRPNKLAWLAWALLAALLLAMIGLRITNPPIFFESNLLVLVLNFLFSTLVSLYIAYLIGRIFLARGSLGLLLLGCGIVSWGAAGVVANVASQGNPNLDVTIHNLGVLLSAFFHLAGATFLLGSNPAVRVPAAWVGAAYVGAVGAVGLVALLALHGYAPAFFVPGEGGSLLRQTVVGSSIGMFLLTALLMGSQRQSFAFTYWYRLALIAIAVGLLGLLLQSTIGGLLSWVGRAALYVGGIYMLVAALASAREAKIWGVPLEESLRQATAKLADVIESISDGFISVDAYWRYTYVNGAAERMFGKSRTELLGKNLLKVTPQAIDSSAFNALETASMQRTFVEFEHYDLIMQRWFRNRAFPAPDGGMTIYIQDVTDRKQAEAKIEALNTQLYAELQGMTRLQELSTRMVAAGGYQHLLEEIVNAAIELTSADMGNIQFVEDDSLKIVAQRGFEAPFLEFFTTVHDGHGASCGAARQNAARVIVDDVAKSPIFAGTQALEVMLAASARAVQSTPLVSRSGRLLGVFSTHFHAPHRPTERELRLVDLLARQAADLIETRQAEESLRVADRRKDDFLATLAHELRNPLAPLRNSLELLRRAGDDQLSSEHARGMMERQVSQLVRLVDDLLDVSRVTNGKLQLRKEPVELRDVLKIAIESAHPLMQKSAHEFTVALPRQPVYVQADLARLAQVFLNLLSNAVKYSDRGGHIFLTAERRGNEAIVAVRDTGIGIPSEHLPHIFEMFSQVTSALERSQGGLGIGLSLVKGLVELHGGTIEARSGGPGQGSEFTVHLPIVDAPIEPVPISSSGNEVHRVAKCRILVVDDLRDSADSMAIMLRIMGHETRKAYDGMEAVQAAAAFQPKIVLLDIGLPIINGYEVARRIRQQPWGGSVAIVALTGWGQEEDKRKALEAGFDYHLTKPVEIVTLEQLLADLAPSPHQ
jgi:PAS domain S-box-containing protein